MGNDASVPQWEGNISVFVCGLPQSGKSKFVGFLCGDGANATVVPTIGWARRDTAYKKYGFIFNEVTTGNVSRDLFLQKAQCIYFLVRTPCDLILAKNLLYRTIVRARGLPVCIVHNPSPNSAVEENFHQIQELFDLDLLSDDFPLYLQTMTYDQTAFGDMILNWTIRHHRKSFEMDSLK